MTIFTCPENAEGLAETDAIMAKLEAEQLQKTPASGKLHFVKQCRRAFKALLADPKGLFRILTRKKPLGSIKVAVVADGGIGDFLRINAVIAAFSKKYPNSCYDVFTGNSGRARLTFAGLSGLECIVHKYLLNWVQGRYDVIYESHWGMVKARFGPAAPPELAQKRQQSRHLFALAEEYDGGSASNTMGRKAVAQGFGYMDVLGLSAGLESLSSMTPVLDLTGVENVMSGQHYITVHHGWDTSNDDQNTPVKCWPLEHWQRFVQVFKQRFPNIKVVQLGAQTATDISGVDVSLVNKTTFKQACSVLAEALLHVDADGGFTHVSRIFGTKTIVLFGPTNSEFTAYRENINIKSGTCGNCAYVTRKWEHLCPRGFSKPICMHSITPEFVMQHAARYVESRLVEHAASPLRAAGNGIPDRDHG